MPCLLLTLVASAADAQNLVSRPVGFLRISVSSNTQVIASQPFARLNETNAAVSREVLTWDAQSGYMASATADVQPGEGFWLANAQSTNESIFLTGEVVLTPSNVAPIRPGLNLVGYPYSSPVSLGETALGALTDRVEILDAAANAPDQSEPVLGKGYWVKSLNEGAVVWTEVRPYENVFPQKGPSISINTIRSSSASRRRTGRIPRMWRIGKGFRIPWMTTAT